MSLEVKITNDLKEAMKNKDQAALRSVRAIKAAILLFKTDGSGNALDETAEIKILQKLVKQRQDSLDIYTKQGRNGQSHRSCQPKTCRKSGRQGHRCHGKGIVKLISPLFFYGHQRYTALAGKCDQIFQGSDRYPERYSAR